MPALAVLAVVGAAGSIYGGMQQNKASKAEAGLLREQGDLAVQEAQTNAQNEAYNQTQAVQKQRLAFLSNGVTLEGSPSMVLEQSKAYGQSQVDAILKQGNAKATLDYGEASITANKGRAALIGGFTSAAGGLAGSYPNASKAGMFDPSEG